MTAEGVRSHSSAQPKTSSSSSSEQNATVFLPPLPADDPLSLTMGEVRPESHGLGAALRSGVIGGVYLRQLLRPRRARMEGFSSGMGAPGETGRRVV